MDILTHTLSGIAAASAVATLSSRPLKDKSLMICCGAAGAMLPDLDAVTRWSGFDAIIGQPLELTQTGRSIYYGHHWYSHHSFMHSLAAAAMFTLAAALLGYLNDRRRSDRLDAFAFTPERSCFLLSFLIGYLMHLLGDLPTPGSVWGGVKLFWPLDAPVGGYGYIWWWNNYDIFLIFMGGCAINAALILLNRSLKMGLLRHIPALIFLVMICAAVIQITHRPTRFNSVQKPATHAVKERRSQDAQRKILGRRLYGMLNALDRKMPIPF